MGGQTVRRRGCDLFQIVRCSILYMETTHDRELMKIVVMGDSRAGKTSIVMRYFGIPYAEDAPPASTIGVDSFIKRLTRVKDGTTVDVSLHIWDTAGQERFLSLAPNYFRSADGALAVFDLSNPRSFPCIRDAWMPELIRLSPDCKILLIGNKCDLPLKADREEIEDYRQKLGLEYVETSAKEDLNIQKCFDRVVEMIMENRKKDPKRGWGWGIDKTPLHFPQVDLQQEPIRTPEERRTCCGTTFWK